MFKTFEVKFTLHYAQIVLKLEAHVNRVVGGRVASWLVRSTLERAVRVSALAGDIDWVDFLGKTLYSQSASIHPGV